MMTSEDQTSTTSTGKNTTSRVWEYFIICENDELKASCNICEQRVSRGRDRNKLTTSNMIFHLKNRHNIYFSVTPRRRQPTLDQAFERLRPYSKTSDRYIKITTALAEMFVACNLSLRLIETNEFRKFVSILDSQYNPPNRHELTNKIIPDLNTKVIQKVKENIGGGDIAITADIWTSRQTLGYLSITGHLIGLDDQRHNFVLSVECLTTRHTSDHIRAQLEAQLEAWGIGVEAVKFGVSDNGLNIANAINSMGIENIRCMAHTINLVAESCLSDHRITRAVEKCRKIVAYVHNSSPATLELVEIQGRLGLKPRKLIQDVQSRWNSTYYMIDRIVEQRQAITQLGTIFDLGTEIDRNQWLILGNLIPVLEPMEIVTKELSSNNASISNSIPIIINLASQYSNMSRAQNEDGDLLYSNVQIAIDIILNQINKRFCSPHEVQNPCRIRRYFYDQRIFDECCLATFLDARFKHYFFRDVEAIRFSPCSEAVKRRVIEMMQEVQIQDTESVNVVDIENNTSRRSILFMSTNRPQISPVSEELAKYMSDPLTSMTEDPVSFWTSRAAKSAYPHLAKIAVKYAICPPTSVPSERLFSNMSLVLSPRRSKLKPVTAEMLARLKANMKALNYDY